MRAELPYPQLVEVRPVRLDVQNRMCRDHARRGDGRDPNPGKGRIATHVEPIQRRRVAHELSRGCREEGSIGSRVSPVKSSMGQGRRGQRDLDALAHVGHVALDGPPQNLDGLFFRLPVGRRLVATVREELFPIFKRLGRLRFVER